MCMSVDTLPSIINGAHTFPISNYTGSLAARILSLFYQHRQERVGQTESPMYEDCKEYYGAYFGKVYLSFIVFCMVRIHV